MDLGWWRDGDLQKSLITFLVKDRVFLKNLGGRLTKEDFRNGDQVERFVVASLALGYWKRYKEPIGGMLRTEVLRYTTEHNTNKKAKDRLAEFVDQIQTGPKLASIEAIEDKISEYLREKKTADTIDQVLELRAKGELTPELFVQKGRELVEWSSAPKLQPKDLFSPKALEGRIRRRAVANNARRPLLMIDELDARVEAIGRGDIGMWYGPQKKGKSLALAHTAIAYAQQRLRGIYISLEDPEEEVEDRFDASISGLPINKLAKLPNKLRKRFEKFAKVVLGRIRFIDGREHAVGVDDIEEIYLRLREEGFQADFVCIDYDKYLRPPRQLKEKLQEWDELYVALRRLTAKYQLITWVAAQSNRGSFQKKIITGKDIGEDVGKTQKVTMFIGIGQGDYGTLGRYLYVGGHKRGKSEIGVDIVSNPAFGLFYDREGTHKAARLAKLKTHPDTK